MHTDYDKRALKPGGSLIPCEPKRQNSRSVLPTATVRSIRNHRNSKTDPEVLTYFNLYGSQWQTTVLSTPNGEGASDWLRPSPWQREGDKLPKGAYQPGGGYSTGVAGMSTQPEIPRALQRETSHVSPQGKEAVFVTHDTFPQVVKASALYYKNKKHMYKNHR